MTEGITYAVMYWSKLEDVLYITLDPRPAYLEGTVAYSLFWFMQKWIVEGETVEILDYVANDPEHHDGANVRCERWRKQLREQGYPMYRIPEKC